MRRVIKVGGSLLSSPNLPDSLTRWIERQGVAENLVVVGGGELVDAIRKLDQIRPSDPVKTHWRCIELMEMTRSIFADWFDWDSIITSRQLETVMANEFSSERPTVGRGQGVLRCRDQVDRANGLVHDERYHCGNFGSDRRSRRTGAVEALRIGSTAEYRRSRRVGHR